MLNSCKWIFVLSCWMLLAQAEGADLSNMVSLSGTIKGGEEVRVTILKSWGKQVEKLVTYYCSNENPDFACWIPFEGSVSYTVSFQVYKLQGDRMRYEKVAQFPLSLKRGMNYELAVDAEKLDHTKKTGLIIKAAATNKGKFLLNGVINGVEKADECTISKIVNGVPVMLCNYGVSPARNTFFFAIPNVKEGFMTVSGSNWNVRCYAKPNDTLFIGIDAEEGHTKSVAGSIENTTLHRWENLLAPVAVDEYRRVRLKKDTISMNSYLSMYYQQLAAVPEFDQYYTNAKVTCSNKFKQLFALLRDADLELMPLWYYQTFLSSRDGRMKGFETKVFPAVPDEFRNFIVTTLFSDSNVLELPEIGRLLHLHSMLLASDSAGRSKSTLLFSEQMAITMAAIENEKVKLFFLMKQLDDLEVFNYTEFQETFAPFSSLISSPQTKAKYQKVQSQFISDTAYLGKPANDFVLPDANGKMVSMNDLTGKVVFIDVWASWCGPCKDQAPYLKELAGEYADNDKIEFVGISIDKQADSLKWQRAIQQEVLPGIQLLDDGGKQFGRKYRISSIPRFLLIDKSGKWKEIRCPRPSQKELLKKYLDDAIRA